MECTEHPQLEFWRPRRGATRERDKHLDDVLRGERRGRGGGDEEDGGEDGDEIDEEEEWRGVDLTTCSKEELQEHLDRTETSVREINQRTALFEKAVEGKKADQGDVYYYLQKKLDDNYDVISELERQDMAEATDTDRMVKMYEEVLEEMEEGRQRESEPLLARIEELKEWVKAHKDIGERKHEVDSETARLTSLLAKREAAFHEEMLADQRRKVKEKTLLRERLEENLEDMQRKMLSLEEGELMNTTKRTAEANLKLHAAVGKTSKKAMSLMRQVERLTESNALLRHELGISDVLEQSLTKRIQDYRQTSVGLSEELSRSEASATREASTLAALGEALAQEIEAAAVAAVGRHGGGGGEGESAGGEGASSDPLAEDMAWAGARKGVATGGGVWGRGAASAGEGGEAGGDCSLAGSEMTSSVSASALLGRDALSFESLAALRRAVEELRRARAALHREAARRGAVCQARGEGLRRLTEASQRKNKLVAGLVSEVLSMVRDEQTNVRVLGIRQQGKGQGAPQILWEGEGGGQDGENGACGGTGRSEGAKGTSDGRCQDLERRRGRSGQDVGEEEGAPKGEDDDSEGGEEGGDEASAEAVDMLRQDHTLERIQRAAKLRRAMCTRLARGVRRWQEGQARLLAGPGGKDLRRVRDQKSCSNGGKGKGKKEKEQEDAEEGEEEEKEDDDEDEEEDDGDEDARTAATAALHPLPCAKASKASTATQTPPPDKTWLSSLPAQSKNGVHLQAYRQGQGHGQGGVLLEAGPGAFQEAPPASSCTDSLGFSSVSGAAPALARVSYVLSSRQEGGAHRGRGPSSGPRAARPGGVRPL